MSPGESLRIPLRLLNAGNNYLKIYANSNIAELEEIEKFEEEPAELKTPELPLTKKTNRNRWPSEMLTLDETILSTKAQQQLKKLVDKLVDNLKKLVDKKKLVDNQHLY